MFLERLSPGIARITLDHPPANALGHVQIEQLTAAVREAAAIDDCRVLVIRGSGRFFCAGADIGLMRADGPSEERVERLTDIGRKLQRLYAAIEGFPAPTVAAIAGTATGGGLELAIACDFRIAARETKLGLLEINLGLIPGAGGTQRMVGLVGRAWTLDLILRGRLITGEEAQRIGLVHEAVDLAQVEARALELAEELAAQPREAVREAKRCINLALSQAGFDAEIEGTRRLQGQPETIQRIEAFLARRSRS